MKPLRAGMGGGWGVRPTAGVPIPEENWYPVVVEVVYSVPGSIPERVQYANMDCPWWIVLWYNPVSGLQRFLCHAIMSIAMIQKGLEPNGCGRSILDTNFF